MPTPSRYRPTSARTPPAATSARPTTPTPQLSSDRKNRVISKPDANPAMAAANAGAAARYVMGSPGERGFGSGWDEHVGRGLPAEDSHRDAPPGGCSSHHQATDHHGR